MNEMLDIEILNEELFEEIENFQEIKENQEINIIKTDIKEFEEKKLEIINNIKKLIEKGADINCIGEDEYTPLTYAIKKEITEIVNLLFQYEKLDINKNDGYKEKPLTTAIRTDNIEIIDFFIKRWVDIKEIFIKAILLDKERIIKYLIEKKGVNPNAILEEIIKNKDKKNKYRYRKIINSLINTNKLNEQTINDYKDELLIPAIVYRNTEFVKHLINKGVDINKEDRYEDIPFNAAIDVAIKRENIEIMELLIDKEFNEEKKKILLEHKDELLMPVIKHGNVDLVKFLINDDFANVINMEHLIKAIKQKNTKVAKFLIYNINNVNVEHLFEAIDTENIEIIKILIEKNKNIINKENNYNFTPLARAIGKKNAEIVRFLIDNGAQIDGYDLINAMRCENNEIIGILNDKKNNIIVNSDHLMLAIEKKNIKTLELLIDKSKEKNIINYKHLIKAIEIENKEIVEFLINKNKTLINQEDENGCTPLIYASIKTNKDIAEYLIQNGATINQKNKHKCTALDLVNELYKNTNNEKYKDLIQLLKEKSSENFKESEKTSQESGLTKNQTINANDPKFTNFIDDSIKYPRELTPEEFIEKYYITKENICNEILKNLKEILGDEILEKYLNEDFDTIYEMYQEKNEFKSKLKKCKDYFGKENKNNFECFVEKILATIANKIIFGIYQGDKYQKDKQEKLSKLNYLKKHEKKYKNNFLRDLYLEDKDYNVWIPFLSNLYGTHRYFEAKWKTIGNKQGYMSFMYDPNALSTSSSIISNVIKNLGLSDDVIVKDTKGETKYGKIDKLEQIYTSGKIQISVIKTNPSHVICVDGRGEEPVIYCSYYHFYETENQSSLNKIYDEKFLEDNIKYFSKESFKQNNKSSTCPLIATLYAKLLSEGKTKNLQQKALNYDLPSKLKYILVDSLNEDKIDGRAKSDVLKELKEKVYGKQGITI